MTEIKLALLDMNKSSNKGMKISQISATFQKNSEFDVKLNISMFVIKNEIPNVATRF